MIDINNPSNYKKCRKKIYDIYCCIPEKYTVVINKLEQPDAFKQAKGDLFTAEQIRKNPALKQMLGQLASIGKAYVVSDDTPVVLCGTRGEKWLVSSEKLCRSYMFLTDNSPVRITESVIQQKKDQGILNWTRIRSIADTSEAYACFVPNSEKGQIQTPWGPVLMYNARGVKHGKGDFIIAQVTPNGKPNLTDRYVVNGAVFKDTYNNRGWESCLEETGGGYQISYDALPNIQINKKEPTSINPELLSFLKQCLNHFAKTQHSELPVQKITGTEDGNDLCITVKVVDNFANKISTKKTHMTSLCTKITVDERNVVSFLIKKANDKGSNGKVYSYCVPFNAPSKHKNPNYKADLNQVMSYIKQNFEIVFGLCGYAKGVNIQNHFRNIEPFSKEDYDGFRDYTLSSGATNRYLRGLGDASETTGRGGDSISDTSSAIRTTARCDSAFDKCVISQPVRVFRGCPVDDRYTKIMQAQGKNPLSLDICGASDVNDAFNSTSLNMTSAVFFAYNGDGEIKDGVVYTLSLPVGTRAVFAHNIAGWVQQYEIMLDRCYDTLIGDTILAFKDNTGYKYKVVEAQLVPHQPNGSLNKIFSNKLIEKGILNYDVNGKVPIEKELSEGILHSAYQIIQHKGLDVQYSPAFSGKYKDINVEFEVETMIVLRGSSNNEGVVTDTGFVLRDGYLLVKNIHGKANQLRNDHADAKDLHYQNYGLQDSFAKGSKWAKGVSSEFDFSGYMKEDNRRILKLSSIDEKCVANRIMQYAKSHKNISMLPILDIARYFDLVMAQVIDTEGYELKSSIRIERKGVSDVNDNQAGYVPCRYTINGDNDDNLVINCRFMRDKGTGKLIFEYNGRSEGTKVEESKKIGYDIFNDETMLKLCMTILYTFEKKMKLSRTRKLDKVLKYFCYQTGCRMVCDYSESNGHNIKNTSDGIEFNSKDSISKTYKIWAKDNRSYMSIYASTTDRTHYELDILDTDASTKQLISQNNASLDLSNNIYNCYHAFVEALIIDRG